MGVKGWASTYENDSYTGECDGILPLLLRFRGYLHGFSGLDDAGLLLLQGQEVLQSGRGSLGTIQEIHQLRGPLLDITEQVVGAAQGLSHGRLLRTAVRRLEAAVRILISATMMNSLSLATTPRPKHLPDVLDERLHDRLLLALDLQYYVDLVYDVFHFLQQLAFGVDGQQRVVRHDRVPPPGPVHVGAAVSS